MKLYYIPASCSLSPHIVLNELGLDATLIKVDHKKHLTELGANYFEVNSFGYVPAIELDDGTLLREGPAIVQYLGDLKPELGLVPINGTLDRYRLQEWLSFLTSEIHKGYIPLLYSTLAGKYVDTAKPKLEKRFAWIDEQLTARPYLLGDSFTVADAYLFALTGWGQAAWLTSYYKADIHFDSLHNLRAWYDRVKVRPAVQKALREEGLV
ncbi:glutathione transferase GstA [Pseudomonas extremaustralis]|uniref:glutathione transferase GstA n=1 Tax=Pseudomonas extremaustralis TaxID=359110 RepID=UPI0023071E57|nr:glutathione transferase GstA [Pseudomonas extremaustralis]MDB1112233.1 glutathione transferase GstA [Pseudomonas extremaustralis]MDG2971013.1 glutathione transferase GstA [Pseudomonas extremaustralis]